MDMGGLDWGAVGSLSLFILLLGAIAYRWISPGASTRRRLLISAAAAVAAVAVALALVALVFALGGTPNQ